MKTHAFIKEGGLWFIDLPHYLANGGSKGDLQMVAGADIMLDFIAGGNNRVTITMHDAPFAGADELQLIELCDQEIGGGIYLMQAFEGKTYNQRMWLCAVTNFVFGYMPKQIFVKRST